jgi:hypothetical protein
MNFLQLLKKKELKSLDNKKTLQEQEFKKNDLVVIISSENSNLNCYKGYYGEIKHYIKGGDKALIILEAMNSSRLINFPINHIIKRTSDLLYN